MGKNKKSYSLILASSIFILLTLFFLRGIIFSPGIISGGDWGLPFTSSQMFRYFERGFFTWSEGSLFGNEQFFLNLLPFHLLIGLFAKLGITGNIHTKLFLISAFVVAAFNMFLFCRFLNCDKKVAIFGGFLYITLPFFFNYAAMGWLFVLISMGILPLALIFFIRSIKEEKISYSIFTGLLYFLATVQSQTIIWYPLVFLSLSIFLVNNKRSLFIYLRSFLIIFLVFITLSSFWLLPLFLGDKNMNLNTNLGLSSGSLGTWIRLGYLNIFRGWGSLYNFQYEQSYPGKLEFISFLLPFLAYSSLYFLKKNKLVYSLVLLSLVPIMIFILGPSFIVKLPFSDLFRDVARFLVLSSFAYVVLATLVLDSLLKNKQKLFKVAGLIFSILLIINSYPFLTGKISGKDKYGFDIRLRTYEFFPEYFELENNLRIDKTDTKILYLPIGGGLNIIGDDKFDGAYRGMRDIFAAFSPKQGPVATSDKGIGSANDLTIELDKKMNSQNYNGLTNLLNLMDIKYIAVKKNVSYSSNFLGEEAEVLLNEKTDIKLLKKWNKISLFENKNFLPHFYIPQDIIYYSGGVANLFDIINFKNKDNKLGFYLNDTKFGDLENLIQPDEIFIKTDLVNEVSNDFLNKKETFKYDTPFPFVKHKPGSFFWKLAKLKERYGEWRIKSDSASFLNKKFFFTDKTISELQKFGLEILDKKIIKFTGDLYRVEMKEIIKEIKRLKSLNSSTNEEALDLFTIELRAYWERHKGKIEEIMGNLDKSDDKKEFLESMNDIFSELDIEIKTIEKKIDLENLEYSLEIPKEGEYEILIKNENNKEASLNSTIISLDNKEVSIKIIKPDKDGWISIGKRNFEEGKHKLTFHLSSVKNLKAYKINQPQIILRKKIDDAKKDYSPKITFIKVNPTKYRVKVENAIKAYDLVFSESFHRGWKVYVKKDQSSKIKNQTSYGKETASYFNGEIKEGTHKNIFLNRNTFETWGKKPIPEKQHLLINGYANSWYITPEDTGGENNYELIIEFRPQRFFYIGLALSLFTIIALFFYLVYNSIKDKKNLKKRT